MNGNANLDASEPKDRFEFIDDASLAQLIRRVSLLIEYDTWKPIPSDVGIYKKNSATAILTYSENLKFYQSME